MAAVCDTSKCTGLVISVCCDEVPLVDASGSHPYGIMLLCNWIWAWVTSGTSLPVLPNRGSL